MFEDSLVESSGRLRQRNPWTTAVSFAAQGILGAGLALLSLLYTDALPIRTLISAVEAPPPPAAQAPVATHAAELARAPSEFEQGVLIVPRQIPKAIATIRDEQAVAESSPLMSAGVAGAVPYTPANNTLANLLRETPRSVPPPELQKVRVSSGVAQGLLIYQVKPQYPRLALQARVQGTVILEATIGKDGIVQDLRVVSGHPLLTGAAIDAVKQWRYRPYLLNNEPVSVDTQINVNFTLARE